MLCIVRKEMFSFELNGYWSEHAWLALNVKGKKKEYKHKH